MLKKIGITRKRARKSAPARNTETTLIERSKVAEKLITYMFRNKEIIYIDECGFNMDLIPLYGYAKKKIL